MTQSRIPQPRVPIIEADGTVNPDWYRYFASLEKSATDAAAGEVLGTDGLTGGGPISEGAELSLADGGVTNEKLRDGLGTSVIGRFQNSTGDVADIQATADRRVLGRVGGLLVFTAHPEAESIEIDELRLTGAPSASASTTTHKLAIEADGTTYYLLLSNV